MIAVIVPAHNEEQHLGDCLDSLRVAAACPALGGEPVLAIVVLDACIDGTAQVAARHGATTVAAELRNVGAARALGAEAAIARGARWLAFTDADSRVDPGWLHAQLALESPAVCGTVTVKDWVGHSTRVVDRFHRQYVDADGHRHIHGANLGLTAAAYRQTGGFRALVSGEDVALVGELERRGVAIAWSAAPRVFTSALRSFRAPRGFGAHLIEFGREAAATP